MHNFSELLIVLGVAGLTVPLLHRLRISPVLGYLLCGILLAPKGPFFWAEQAGSHAASVAADAFTGSDALENFGELGIVILMFTIGLKLSLNELWKMRHAVIGLGGAQVLVTGAVIYAVARAFGNGIEVSLLMGASLALSSTAVVMQLLEEKRNEGSAIGKLSFSILLMQDLMVVPILALVAALSDKGEEPLAYMLGKAILIAAAAISVIYVVGMRILPPLLHWLNPRKRRDWLMSFVLFVLIGTAMLTEAAGLSAALGAFLAGLLLAETSYRKEIETIISPVKSILMGVFFLSVGLMFDLRLLAVNALWLTASVIGLGALKAGILYLLARGFGTQKRVAAETAIMLGQAGEFSFVILTLALSADLMPAKDAQFFMLVTALSMFVTPVVTALAPGFLKFVRRR
ncbi:MAG TPA: cation:proton antiporter [Patescibacteria group bacterium]|nr:cation:proton antiporter [Patescibacteria group bacterium]